jgi:hypothetical protein
MVSLIAIGIEMEQKRELSHTLSDELSKEIKNQQVLNCLIGNKLVDAFGNQVEECKKQITSNLTEDDFNKAHNTTALTCSTLFSLFKPNFKSELVNKLVECVAMGEQYAFCTEVLTQEPSELDIKEVTQKRKILFISKNNHFEMCYCSDNWDYVRVDVTDEALKTILRKYTENQPNAQDLSTINQILTKSGIRTQQDKAERLLKTSPELMLEEITFTDCSGRTFEKISAFTFLLWALDTRYGVDMMLNCLPNNEKGLEIAEKLKEQYDHHKKYGVTYTLEGQTINEKHFDFSVLINALQTYVDNFDKLDWPQREAHWCKVVGMAQRYVPAHVMQHYCDPNVPFSPLPKFEAEQFIRTLKFYNYASDQEMTWRGITSSGGGVLGENFGVLRGASVGVGVMRGACGQSGLLIAAQDLLAIAALCEVRTSDYLAVPSKLASLFKKIEVEDETPNSCGIQ